MTLTPGAVVAREWARLGSWAIVQTDEGCSMGRQYQDAGKTVLTVTHMRSGGVVIGTRNDRWSTKAGDTLPLRYVFGSRQYADALSVGTAQPGALAANVGDSILADLASASRLTIYLGSEIAADLPLDGSQAALAGVAKCMVNISEARR